MPSNAIPSLAIVALLATAAGPASPVRSLAGRYAYHDIDPFTHRPLDNVLEIVPVDATHAYFRVALQQENGMSCDVSGIARTTADGVYYQERSPAPGSNDRCELTITRDRSELIVDDSDSHHCHAYCGVNATLSDGFPVTSRRPISYLARLQRSTEYRRAVAAWKAAKPR